MNTSETIAALTSFRNSSNFSSAAWIRRGLNPSSADVCDTLETVFNSCSEKLIYAVQTGAGQRNLKSILKSSLRSVRRFDYDTEEREFICDTYEKLSKIVGVNMSRSLNIWLYGWLLITILDVFSVFKKKEVILETVSQPCTDCGGTLETHILRKGSGLPDSCWTIVQCNLCREFNLLNPLSDVIESKRGNYEIVELLHKTEFSVEKAQIRLDQIKFFRRK